MRAHKHSINNCLSYVFAHVNLLNANDLAHSKSCSLAGQSMPNVSLTCSFAINPIQENLKMPETTHTHSWPELAIGLAMSACV